MNKARKQWSRENKGKGYNIIEVTKAYEKINCKIKKQLTQERISWVSMIKKQRREEKISYIKELLLDADKEWFWNSWTNEYWYQITKLKHNKEWKKDKVEWKKVEKELEKLETQVNKKLVQTRTKVFWTAFILAVVIYLYIINVTIKWNKKKK